MNKPPTDDVEGESKKTSPEAVIIINEQPIDDVEGESKKTYVIVAENIILMNKISDLKQAIKYLVSVNYVCNLEYPKQGKNTIAFLQRLCGINGGYIPLKVSNMITKIKRRSS